MSIKKPIPGYENEYVMNEFGQIFSKQRRVSIGKKGFKTFPGQRIKPRKTPKGDWVINLSKKGQVKTHMIRTLVAKTYLDTPSQKNMVLEHIDGNPDNLHYKNLRYVTWSYIHKRTHHRKRGSQKSLLMINPQTNRTIKKFKTHKEAYRYLGKKPNSNIYHCLKGHYQTAYGYKWKEVN